MTNSSKIFGHKLSIIGGSDCSRSSGISKERLKSVVEADIEEDGEEEKEEHEEISRVNSNDSTGLLKVNTGKFLH